MYAHDLLASVARVFIAHKTNIQFFIVNIEKTKIACRFTEYAEINVNS